MTKEKSKKSNPIMIIIVFGASALYIALIMIFPVMMHYYEPATMMAVEEFRYYRHGQAIVEDGRYPYDIFGGNLMFALADGDTYQDVSTLRNIHVTDGLDDIVKAYAGLPCTIERFKLFTRKYDDLAVFAAKKENKNIKGVTSIKYTSYFIDEQPVTIKEYKAACRDKDMAESAWRADLYFYLVNDKIVHVIKAYPNAGVM